MHLTLTLDFITERIDQQERYLATLTQRFLDYEIDEERFEECFTSANFVRKRFVEMKYQWHLMLLKPKY